MTIETEICCFSLESAMVAHKLSATRIELCGGFLEGGTTPSQGLIQLVLEKTSPKTFVMIRPRGGDFCYSDSEVLTIYNEINAIKKLNPAGFVFGALKPDSSVDIALCEKVISWAKPFPVTFHRAFDQTKDALKSLEEIIELGFERILTSGLKNSALEGLPLLGVLKEKGAGKIQIMAGAGVNAENVETFVNAGLEAIHFTAKDWVKSPMGISEVSMQSGTLPDDLGRYETSLEKAKTLFEIIYSKKR
ncbi:copper homeostasis protein CutC [uncultured Arcticibacterium sp.]|uniref:copper homeostasis protein CutC n=1 Tax=uncultured Arcticibacterium sp. TaxID=2173042 RepID=UPI0030F8E32C